MTDPRRYVAICHYCERRMWCSSAFARAEFLATLALLGWVFRGGVAACPAHARALSRFAFVRLSAAGPKRAMLGVMA